MDAQAFLRSRFCILALILASAFSRALRLTWVSLA